MSSIEIQPVEETHKITTIKISNIFIDIYSKSISIEIEKLDEVGHVIDRLTLTASGTNYTDIYDEDMIKDFILTQLNLSPL